MKYGYAVGRILDHSPGLRADDVIDRLRRETFVSVPRRYMYFSVPKAANTQMKQVLRLVEGAAPIKLFINPRIWETRREQFVHDRVNVPLPSLVDLDDNTQREALEAPDFFRMTVVRNPYTRLVSAWRGLVISCETPGRDIYLELRGRLPDIHEKSLISFNEFVEYVEGSYHLRTCNRHWMGQVDYTFLPVMNFSCIVKVEQLGEGLRRFQQHLRLSEPLATVGANESLPLGTASYTEEMADKVYALYRPDFEVLRYDRNTWAAPRHNPSRQPGIYVVSEEKLRDEIVERNLTMLGLYEERERLQAQLRWVSRLGLLPAINALIAFESISRKAARKIKGCARRVLRPPRQTDKAMLRRASLADTRNGQRS
jgi:Sulfotransferase family